MGGWKSLYFFSVLFVSSVLGSSSSDRVKLKDVQTLTLQVGHFTNGRRSPGVPQIRCVGGTAGCQAFVPQVVQCYNRGFDGVDYQWECKADMDNAYRFGQISVSCEGYDYPDDPYILKGSCGLEYTLDVTKDGYDQKRYQDQYSYQTSPPKPYKKGYFEDMCLLIVGCIIVYAIYKTCVANPNRMDQRSTTNDDYPHRPDGSSPPPPGFRPSYYPSGGSGGSYGDSCGSAGQGTSGSGGGGFWTGAATGGLLGYMFGNRNSNATGYVPGSRSAGWAFDNWGTRTEGTTSYYRSNPGPSTSSGSRTTSGFGGTRRR